MRDGQTSKLNPPPASIDPGPQVLLRLLLGMTDGLLQLKKNTCGLKYVTLVQQVFVGVSWDLFRMEGC